MKKLTPASAKKLMKDLETAMDNGQAKLLINTQSKLSASSPVDTGRLASSWMIGKNSMDTSVPPEREKGSSSVSVTEYSDKITFEGDWHLSSSLPYAQRAALDPGYVGRRGGGSGDWFTSIENNLPRDAKTAFDEFLNKVK